MHKISGDPLFSEYNIALLNYTEYCQTSLTLHVCCPARSLNVLQWWVVQLRAGPALANLAAAEKMLMMLCWLLLLLLAEAELRW